MTTVKEQIVLFSLDLLYKLGIQDIMRFRDADWLILSPIERVMLAVSLYLQYAKLS